tara:strand:- start:185 stop:460 length:276 start_codon:yes stop_codon:yes gene_type:complete
MILFSCKKHHVSKNIHGGNMSKLKNRIKAALAKEGYNLADLARRMDIHQSSLSIYLRGNMRMSTALKISSSLADMTGYHLTLNDFRKDEDQ